MKQEGVVPAGDYVLALTAGEEGGGGYNGIEWLVAHRRDLMIDDVAYVLNADAGGGELRDGKPVALDVQAAEKVFQTYQLTVRNPGGHSSLPEKDNAIYRLAAALGPRGRVRVSVRDQRRDACVLHAQRRAQHRRARGRDARRECGRQARQRRGRAARRAVAVLQRAAAHDLRGDDARGRPRAQRAPAARVGAGELPHHAGRGRRVGRAHAARGDRRHRGEADEGRYRHAEPAVRASRGGGERDQAP